MFKKVYVEITNKCNLNCSFCVGNNRKEEFIKMDNFLIILDKLKNYTNYLYFHVMGEPLLHPDINNLINEASKNFFVNITTNGYLIRRICHNTKVRQVNISLHSFEPSYGIKIDDYMNTIFNSVNQLITNNTIICYRLWTKGKYNQKIISKLEEKYNIVIDEQRTLKLANNIYLECAEEFIWPTLDNSLSSEVGSCKGLKDHIGILVDGTVVPCCLDSAGIINLGNIYNQDLSDIINSKLFKTLKNGFLNNKKIHELCKKCNFYESKKGK